MLFGVEQVDFHITYQRGKVEILEKYQVYLYLQVDFHLDQIKIGVTPLDGQVDVNS